jgi:hypothetical protein
LHGSVSWRAEGKNIELDKDLKLVDEIQKSLINEDNKFKENYDKLMIVNPSKKKFKDTVLNETHYDLLRMYSNELEKENSVLFVMGFSFADEHIRELTLRVANTNPTSIIYIFVYDEDDSEIYKESVVMLFVIFLLTNFSIVSWYLTLFIKLTSKEFIYFLIYFV